MFASLRKALDWLQQYVADWGKWSKHNQASSVAACGAFLWAGIALAFDLGGDVVVLVGLGVFSGLVPLLNMITDNPTDADDQ